MIPILCSFYEEELQQSSFSMLKYCNFSPFIHVIRIYGGWHNNVNTVSFIASARNELKTCGLDQKKAFSCTKNKCINLINENTGRMNHACIKHY